MAKQRGLGEVGMERLAGYFRDEQRGAVERLDGASVIHRAGIVGIFVVPLRLGRSPLPSVREGKEEGSNPISR